MNKNTKLGLIFIVGFVVAATATAAVRHVIKAREYNSGVVPKDVRNHDSEVAYGSQSDDYVDTIKEPLGTEPELPEDVVDVTVVNIIGDGKNEISRTSKEFFNLVNNAYASLAVDEDATLTLYGKLIGLAVAGTPVPSIRTVNKTILKGRMYNGDEIGMLRQRWLAEHS